MQSKAEIMFDDQWLSLLITDDEWNRLFSVPFNEWRPGEENSAGSALALSMAKTQGVSCKLSIHWRVAWEFDPSADPLDRWCLKKPTTGSCTANRFANWTFLLPLNFIEL